METQNTPFESEEINVIISVLQRCPVSVAENYAINKAIESINNKLIELSLIKDNKQ